MKKIFNFLLAATIVAIAPSMTFAQSKKIAIINMEKIVSLMPEKAKADTAVYNYQLELVKEYEAKEKALNDKFNEYNSKSKEYSESLKQLKANELKEDEMRLQNFASQIETELMEKRNKLYAPLMEQIVNASKEVCKEKGFAHVVDATMFIYFDEADSIDELVMAKLKLTAPKTSTPK